MEYVILVDDKDNEVGIMEKIEAHEKALLHRAFSIFILNSNNQLLLQKRADHKYHSPGLWTNTCCSHPRPNETVLEAGNRRLFEEMGMTAKLDSLLSFTYKADFDNGLTEHEFDHVLIGFTDELPKLNPEEVSDYKYVDLSFISKDLMKNPNVYTEWFKIVFDQFKNKISS